MVHILSAEAGWLSRCGGPERGPSLDPADFSTVESLIQDWHTVKVQVREFLDTLKNEDLTRNVEFAIGMAEKRSIAIGRVNVARGQSWCSSSGTGYAAALPVEGAEAGGIP